MVLTPFLKFVIIAAAFLFGLADLVWVGVKADALALDLNEHVYNIVAIVITTLNTGFLALLAYLGLRAPTMEPPPKE